MARRKVKNGEKSPWGQCLTKTVFSGTNQKPERRRPFGTVLVRHCPQELFSPFFTFLRAIYFSARLDFSSSPLSAPGSPRMDYVHPDDQTQPTFEMTLGFKPFTKINLFQSIIDSKKEGVTTKIMVEPPRPY